MRDLAALMVSRLPNSNHVAIVETRGNILSPPPSSTPNPTLLHYCLTHAVIHTPPPELTSENIGVEYDSQDRQLPQVCASSLVCAVAGCMRDVQYTIAHLIAHLQAHAVAV